MKAIRISQTIFTWLIIASGMSVLSMACGTKDDYTVIREPTLDLPLPESTYSRLQDCLDERKDELAEQQHSLKIVIQVNHHNTVHDVRAVGPALADSIVQSCMIHALRNMSMPVFVLEKARREADAQRLAPSGRQFVADSTMMTTQAAELEALITRLGPVVIRAGAVGIVIIIGVVVIAETVKYAEEERARCKAVKQGCIERCSEDFLDTGPTDGMAFHECLRKCLEAQNCWKIFDRPGTRF